MCSLSLFKGHSNDINSIVFSPNGEYLASGSQDQTIGIWRVSTGELIKTLLAASLPITSVVFSPNGEYLASGSMNCNIGVWRV